MRKVWLVIKREYSTRIKTKGFVIGTIAGPVFAVGILAFSIFIATRLTDKTIRLALIDNVGGLAPVVASALDVKLPNGKPEFEVVRTVTQPPSEEAVRKELRAAVRGDRLDAYLAIGAGGKAEFHTKNPGDFTLIEPISRAVHEAFMASRLEARGVHVSEIGDVTRGINV